jgi:uncharacterized protein (TIGR02246 family)
MDPIEKLVARSEITDLIVTYCITFDDQDWDEFAKLWTEDASFIVDDYAFEGRPAVLDFLTNCLPKGYTSKHMLSVPLIEFSGSGRSANCRTDVVWIASNFENAIVGRYNDNIVKQGGAWKFRRRHEIPVPYQEGPAPMSNAAISVSGDTMRKGLLKGNKS